MRSEVLGLIYFLTNKIDKQKQTKQTSKQKTKRKFHQNGCPACNHSRSISASNPRTVRQSVRKSI